VAEVVATLSTEAQALADVFKHIEVNTRQTAAAMSALDTTMKEMVNLTRQVVDLTKSLGVAQTATTTATVAASKASEQHANAQKAESVATQQLTKHMESHAKTLQEAMDEGVRKYKLIESARSAAAAAGKDEEATVSRLEASLLKGSTAYEKTAYQLAKARSETASTTAGIKLQQEAVQNLTKTLETQHDRFLQNRGRSLSMLFDELRNSLTSIPGPIGTVASGLERVAGITKKVGGAGEEGSASIAMMATGLGAAAVGAAAFASAAIVAARQQAEFNKELVLGAQQAGMTAESFSSLRLIASNYGFGMDEFTQGFIQLSGVMQQATVAGTAQAETFEKLGVSVKDATTGRLRDAHTVFIEAAGAISRMTSATEQAVAAQQLFGEDTGKRLLPVLRDGSGKILELEQRARDLGLTLDGDALKATQHYTDATRELTTVWDAFGASLSSVASDTSAYVKDGISAVIEGFTIMTLRVTDGSVAVDKYVKALQAQRAATSDLLKINQDQLLVTDLMKQYSEQSADLNKKDSEDKIKAEKTYKKMLEDRKKAEDDARKAANNATKALQAELDEREKNLSNTLDNMDRIAKKEAEIAADKKKSDEAETDRLMDIWQIQSDNAQAIAEEERQLAAERLAQQQEYIASMEASARSLLSQYAQSSDTAFRIQQGVDLAQVGMDTATAIVKGFALFGPPPSPAGIAAALAATSIGGAQALEVSSAKPPSVSVSDAYIPAGGPRTITMAPGDEASITRSGQLGQTSRLNGGNDAENWARQNAILEAMRSDIVALSRAAMYDRLSRSSVRQGRRI